MIKKGWHVDIAVPRGDVTSELIKNGYNIKIINSARRISFFSNLSTIFQLYKIIKKGKYDIVHTHNHLIGILSRIAAKVSKWGLEWAKKNDLKVIPTCSYLT